MKSLQRIILINSYMPGVVELKVDAHTNVCGINASGKTTLQRLLLVFYGELPSNVVPKTRDSFEKWYLPRASSYIIFEYINHKRELCQAVLSASTDMRAVKYRFISKAYQQEDYVKNSTGNLVEFFDAHELARHLKTAHIDSSTQLSVMDYRAIIQNDTQLSDVLSNKKEIKGYARQYSLCDHRHNLRHIDKLVRAIHTKNGKMTSIKAMIAGILEEEFVRPPESKIKAESVHQWASETVAIEDLTRRRHSIIKLSDLDRQIYGIEHDLGNDLALFTHAIGACKQGIDTNVQRIEHLTSDKQRLLTAWTDQQADLNAEKNAARSTYETSESELDRIEARYSEYLDSGIEGIQQNLSLLSGWQKDLVDQKKQYAMLTSEHSDIERTYAQRKTEIIEKQSRDLKQENGVLQSLQANRSQQAASNHEALRKKESEQQKKLADIASHYQQKISSIETAIASLVGQQSAMSLTHEEALEIDTIEKRIEAFHQEKNRLLVEQSNINKAIDQARKARADAENMFKDICKKVQVAEARKESALASCYPKDGSLLHFLRTQMPDWTETIGKIIRPELLQNKDLKPSVTEDNASAFGLVIELKEVDAPEYTKSETYLVEQVRRASEALSLELLSKEEAYSLFGKKNDALEDAERSAIQSSTNLTVINTKLDGAAQDKVILRARHKAALNQRKADVDTHISTLKGDLAGLTKEKNEAISAAADLFANELLELKVLHTDTINELDRKIKSAEDRLVEIETIAKKLLKDAQQFYNDTLSERGINEKVISECKKYIDDLDARITETIHRRQEVQEFEDWKSTAMDVRKPALLNQVALEKEREHTLKIQLSEALKQYQQSQHEINDQLAVLSAATQQLRDNQKNAERIVYRLKGLGIEAATSSLDSVNIKHLDDRAQASEQHIDGLIRLKAKLKDDIAKIDTLINKSGASKLSEAWERAIKNSDASGERNSHALVADIEIIFNTLLPQLSLGLLEMGKNHGITIKGYYDVLADVNNKISAQSAKITRHLEEDLDLDGVSESSVNIISKITKLDYWGDLKNFMTHLEKWRETGYAEHPDLDYITAIKEVSQILSRSAADKISIIDLLDIEIRLKEGNSHLIIRTDQEMTDSSSQGMAYLILCKFLLAFTRMLRGHSEQVIHWPIDELGTLHVTNIEKVFEACNRNNIIIVGAFPNADLSILKLFTNRYMINPKTKVLSAMRPQQDLLAQKIALFANEQRPTTHQSEAVL